MYFKYKDTYFTHECRKIKLSYCQVMNMKLYFLKLIWWDPKRLIK